MEDKSKPIEPIILPKNGIKSNVKLLKSLKICQEILNFNFEAVEANFANDAKGIWYPLRDNKTPSSIYRKSLYN